MNRDKFFFPKLILTSKSGLLKIHYELLATGGLEIVKLSRTNIIRMQQLGSSSDRHVTQNRDALG
jgi:hypothetical protein